MKNHKRRTGNPKKWPLALLAFSALGCSGAAQASFTTWVHSLFNNAPPPVILPTVYVHGTRLPPDPTRDLNADTTLDYHGGGGSGGSQGGDKEAGDKGTQASRQASKSCPSAGNPIVLTTGNKIEPETDFVSAGESALSLTRTYNKSWGGVGIFGNNWISDYDYKLTFGSENVNSCYPKPGGGSCAIGSNTIIYAHLPDARTIKYIKQADGVFYEDKPTPIAKIVPQGDGTFLLYSEDHNVERYTSAGYVSQVLDEHNVGWTYTYSGTYPTRVTHTSGRYIDFGWSNGQLVTVRDPAGNYYGYSYRTGINMLAAMSKPGATATTIAYYYENTTFPNALTGKSFNGVRYSWFAYDGGGRGISTQHSGGAELVSIGYSAGASGEFIATETNALGKKTAYSFVNDNLVSVTGYASTHCGGTYKNSTYDANGNQDIVADFNSNLTDYDYAANGQLQRMIEAAGTPLARTTTYLWDTAGNRLTSETMAGVASTSYTYSTDNYLASVTVKNLSSNGVANQTLTTTYSYTKYANGLLSSMTVDGPLPGTSDAITSSYSATGDLTAVSNSLGQQVSYSGYNGLGLPGRRIGLNGDITDYTYDAQGRTTNVRTYPNGVTSDMGWTYGPEGLLASTKAPDGVVTFYEYDAARRLLDTYRAANGTAGSETSREKQLYTYDAMSDVIKVENQKLTGNYETKCFKTVIMDGLPECLDERQVWVGTPTTTWSTFTDYDELGRVRARRGNNGQTTQVAYDDNGSIKSTTDSLNKSTFLTYDALGRLSTSTDPLNGITHLEYEAGNHLAKVTDAKGLATTYLYDGFGQLWSQYSPDSGVTTFQYNAAGQRTLMTRADNVSIGYGYDGLGRLTGVANPAEGRTYTYDTCTGGKGLLCGVSENDTAVHSWSQYTYTPEGHLRTQRDSAEGSDDTTAYSYDASGRVAGISYPSGIGVGYGYANGKLTSMTATVGGVTSAVASSINYQPYGGISDWIYGNNLTRTNAYDLDGRLIGISTNNTNGPVQSLTYQFNANNQIMAVTNGVDASQSQSFTYDALSHLTSDTYSGNTAILTDAYDAVGSRTAHTRTDTGNPIINVQYQTESTSNKLTGLSGGASRNVTFNAQGNTVSSSGWGGNRTFGYDNFNRLRWINIDGVTTSYTVNGLNQRVAKTTPAGITRFVYNGQNTLLAEKGPSGWKSYLWLGGQLVGVVTPSNALDFVHTDHLGRPELVTNATQQAVWRGANGSFSRTPTLDNIGGLNILFPGQYVDPETGYAYNGFRDYDASTGRYIETDPIGLDGGSNTYAYVGGNPVNNIDRLGLCLEDACVGEVLMTAGAVGAGSAALGTYIQTGSWSAAAASMPGGFLGGVYAVATFLALPETLTATAASVFGDIAITAGMNSVEVANALAQNKKNHAKKKPCP